MLCEAVLVVASIAAALGLPHGSRPLLCTPSRSRSAGAVFRRGASFNHQEANRGGGAYHQVPALQPGTAPVEPLPP